MKSLLKIALKGVLILVVLSFAIFLEEWIRTLQTQEIPVMKTGLGSSVTVTAHKKPDFLWSGTAWWIDIETTKGLVLELSPGGTEMKVPPGTHKIFRNHDCDNLQEYLNGEFRGVPSSVSVSAQ